MDSVAADCILGIDPGLDGAVAVLVPGAPQTEQIAAVYDMPVVKVIVNGIRKRQIDLYALARIIDTWACRIRMAVIEDPHAMPRQGVTSSFNFGMNCGIAKMAVAASLIPMTLVRPNKWKAAMGLTSDKGRSRELASRLYPAVASQFARVKDDGRAEAVLLALWGTR